jgi:ribose-phosphate pyrophosphokinase
MAKAVKLVKSKGARKVYAACVHPLLMGNAQKRILENGAEEIIGTDSIPTPISKVSIASLITKALSHKGV